MLSQQGCVRCPRPTIHSGYLENIRLMLLLSNRQLEAEEKIQSESQTATSEQSAQTTLWDSYLHLCFKYLLYVQIIAVPWRWLLPDKGLQLVLFLVRHYEAGYPVCHVIPPKCPPFWPFASTAVSVWLTAPIIELLDDCWIFLQVIVQSLLSCVLLGCPSWFSFLQIFLISSEGVTYSLVAYGSDIFAD